MSSRLHTFPSIEASPAPAQPLLQAVNKTFGVTPNLFRVVANSPAALEGFLGLHGALGKGQLDARTRARIALVVAELNACDYCLSAHTYLGEHMSKLDAAEMNANREGGSKDLTADAAVRFAAKVVRGRGTVTDADVQAVKAAGFTDGQIVEI